MSINHNPWDSSFTRKYEFSYLIKIIFFIYVNFWISLGRISSFRLWTSYLYWEVMVLSPGIKRRRVLSRLVHLDVDQIVPLCTLIGQDLEILCSDWGNLSICWRKFLRYPYIMKSKQKAQNSPSVGIFMAQESSSSGPICLWLVCIMVICMNTEHWKDWM